METTARLVPRLNDPVESIRSMAWECVKYLLEILPESGLSGTESEQSATLNSMVFPLADSEVFVIINQVIKDNEQLIKFIHNLIDGLLDHQTSSSLYSSNFLAFLVKSKRVERKNVR